MQRLIGNVAIYAFIGILFGGLFGEAAAQRINQREVRDTVRSLNSRIDDLDYELMFRLESTSAPRSDISEAKEALEGLRKAMRAFEQNLDLRRENRSDVNDVISAANMIKGFLQLNPQNKRIDSVWADIRDLLETLAANYGVTPDWNGESPNGRSSANISDDDSEISGEIYESPSDDSASANGLSGTYRLDTSRSENVADVIATANVAAEERRELETKLEAPEHLTIDIRGNEVTLATSNASPVTFIADGREKVEYAGGRSVRLRATLRGDELTISSIGGETDYTVTFVSENNGRGLRVTRRITTEYLAETLFAESFYEKTGQLLGQQNDRGRGDAGYSSNDPNDSAGANSPNPTLSSPRVGQFIVPDGTIITALLENEVNTKVSQNNDRFRLTVQGPIDFRGAVIEGYLTGIGRSGRVSGRSNVTFNFEKITLRNGQTYDFAGSLQGIKDQTGKEIKVDEEGAAKGGSQTKETVKRGGIGAGIGAIIGGIAGGGGGAAIGAIIGGGVGAGSVVVQGRGDIQLLPGSTITLQASSPIRETRSEN